jgi:hypothetical protein
MTGSFSEHPVVTRTAEVRDSCFQPVLLEEMAHDAARFGIAATVGEARAFAYYTEGPPDGPFLLALTAVG